jgi:hypothetical protein
MARTDILRHRMRAISVDRVVDGGRITHVGEARAVRRSPERNAVAVTSVA